MSSNEIGGGLPSAARGDIKIAAPLRVGAVATLRLGGIRSASGTFVGFRPSEHTGETVAVFSDGHIDGTAQAHFAFPVERITRMTVEERDQELWERYDELDGKTQQDLRIRQNIREAGGVENMTLYDFDTAFEDRDPCEWL